MELDEVSLTDGCVTPAGADRIVPPELSDGDLRLRPWRQDDLSALEPVCGDGAICRFTTVPRTYSATAASAWIARHEHYLADRISVVLAIETAASAGPIGTVWLFAIDDPSRGPRIGCWLAPGERRKGFGSRAVTLLVRWAFEQLDVDAVYLDSELENRASRLAIQKLGAARHSYVRRDVRGASVTLERRILPRATFARVPDG
ncbi:MAG TPA: GNAT family N-acetyltransferase [Solirubrobacteraceae bacterium]